MTARSAPRLLRYGSQLAAGLTIGLTLVLAAQEARADDTVASLMRDPRHLDAVQLGCKTNQPWATDEVCRTAAEAIRRRFRGQGVPYTLHRVDPFPNQPTEKPTPGPKPEVRHRPSTPRASDVQ